MNVNQALRELIEAIRPAMPDMSGENHKAVSVKLVAAEAALEAARKKSAAAGTAAKGKSGRKSSMDEATRTAILASDLKPEERAKQFGISVSTVRRLIAANNAGEL